MGCGLEGRLTEIYRRLYGRYGPQGWWPADGSFEVIVGAILTQSAAWTGVERALGNLKAAGVFSAAGLRRLPHEELAALLRPAVYFNAKARKLKAFANHLGERYGDDLGAMLARPEGELRRELLGIHGIGEETADDIVLYAADKPRFVIDAYTRRLLHRLRLSPQRGRYDDYQRLFEQHLPADARLFNEYHALIDRHCVEVCRPRPRCGGCCLREVCPTAP